MKCIKFAIVLILSAIVPFVASAQNGGVTPEMLKNIQDSYKSSPENKALQNAIAGNDINKIALNFENEAQFDTYFSHRVPSQAGLNVLRAKAIAKYDLPADFQFSQVYLFFWDQLEKSNLFLQAIIDTRKSPMDDKTVEWLFKNPIGDGGQFTGVANLIDKYGVVPAEAMRETNSSNKTSTMSSVLSLKLREYGLELREMGAKKGVTEAQLQQRKQEMLKVVYKILALNFGEPPAEFSWTQRDKSGKPGHLYARLVPRQVRPRRLLHFLHDHERPHPRVLQGV